MVNAPSDDDRPPVLTAARWTTSELKIGGQFLSLLTGIFPLLFFGRPPHRQCWFKCKHSVGGVVVVGVMLGAWWGGGGSGSKIAWECCVDH